MKEISLHVLDILQNSVEADATEILLYIDESTEKDLLRIIIKDNGRGMDEKLVKCVLDPFKTTRKTRRVGLGLSLFQMTARQCEGDLTIASALGKGTRVNVVMKYGHWDRPPLGNMADTIISFLMGSPSIELKYIHKKDNIKFMFETKEVKEMLEDEAPFENSKVAYMVKGYLEQELSKLYGGEING
ncbi:ATP-binding protein [Natranaerofaba carboxydovora]|uniref:ATP-binding protein n=1 Tax=Natranaerofaba carboxydovora TaxID=2742683 RepID=UPI001F147893|nr:ATP-binding protein [Natranaerofaba carboxydovora]UMZ75298.1 Tetrathionate sensor histidine kinase TtrS [Natranaerofaba carboxydovora]